MPFDRYLIAPINSGLQTDLRPWLIMDDAFEYLQNVYVFRGRVRKRFGSELMGNPPTQLTSRLRINIGNTPGPINLPNGMSQLAIGQMFSVGNDIFTVFQLGAGVLTLSTNAGASATIDSTVNPNTVTFVGEPGGTAVFYYPATPVMGIDQYESGSINNHPTFAFDTQFAYTFTAGAWTRSGSVVTPIWHGTDTNFFWTTNWQGLAGNPVLFVTNFNATLGAAAPAANDDPIWTFDGTTWVSRAGSSANGFFFRPAGGARTASPFIQTARIIVPFKNRLVLLNTIENDNSLGGGSGTATQFVNRCRYSFNGSPFANNAWYEPNQTDAAGAIAAGAGFIDASTEEQIISAEFIKDRLIVYFERSTWELAYTGNEILPFVWQKINTELGSQSTFSTVPFDKAVLTIGNTGVHACTGANVERIDQKIPDEIFEFSAKNNAPLRTAGIRDYITEMVYWAFVADFESTTQKYPNQILVYNYRNGSWALNDDCFTAFGYFEQQTDTTWASSGTLTWAQANFTWISGINAANQRIILGGTPEGFVLRIIPDEVSRNAPSMQITNITFAATGIITLKIINHNTTIAGAAEAFPDYLLFENIVGDALTMAILNGSIFVVNSIIDANTITINTNGLLTSGTYNGGGTVARVSNIQIRTKRFNPYVQEDRNLFLQKVDFAVQQTQSGQITVDYYPSATELSMIQEGLASGAILGNNILETTPYPVNLAPLEQFQSLLWHPIYFQSSGEFIQLALYMSPLQMTTPAIATDDFELEGFCLYTQRSGQRMQ